MTSTATPTSDLETVQTESPVERNGTLVRHASRVPHDLVVCVDARLRQYARCSVGPRHFNSNDFLQASQAKVQRGCMLAIEGVSVYNLGDLIAPFGIHHHHDPERRKSWCIG